jgi:hypothetical protein
MRNAGVLPVAYGRAGAAITTPFSARKNRRRGKCRVIPGEDKIAPGNYTLEMIYSVESPTKP